MATTAYDLTTATTAFDPELFQKTGEIKINGRTVQRGTEITVQGHGRMIFIEHVTNTKTGAEWIDCVDKNKRIRSFRPEAVKRVHYKEKLRH